MSTAADSVRLRTATADDAAAIARLHIASWRAVYRAELPADFLNALNEEQRTKQWRERLAVATTEVLLADRSGSVLGFCAHGPVHNATRDLTSCWEIYGLHVAPDLRGSGIGSRLFSAARDRGREQGAAWLTLWVVATNAPARRFYEAKGMLLDGAEKHRELAPGVVLHEVRYKVPLG